MTRRTALVGSGGGLVGSQGGLVGSAPPEAFTLDAAIRLNKAFWLDAVIEADRPASFALRAVIKGTVAGTGFTLAAVIKATKGFGGSATEFLRPISDVARSGVFFSSGSTGWSLVDEAVLDTADNYGFNPGDFIFHGFPPSAIVQGATISRVVHSSVNSSQPPSGTSTMRLRNPATGTSYVVGSVTQDPAFTPPQLRRYASTTRPWDSAAWNLDDIARLQAGFVGTSTFRVHQLYLEIDYAYTGGIVLNAYLVGAFTLDARIGNVIEGDFTLRAVIKRVGTPVVGSLVFPGASLAVTGGSINVHSPPIAIGAGGFLDIFVSVPPSDGGSVGIYEPTTEEFDATPGVPSGGTTYRFTLLGGSYYVVSALGAAYRPGITGAGEYIDYSRSTHTFSLNAVIFGTRTGSFFLDAEHRNIIFASFTLAARVMPRATLDAVIRKAQAGSFTLRSWAIIVQTGSFAVSAWVQQYFYVRAVIRGTAPTRVFNLSAAIRPPNPTFTLNARKAPPAKQFTIRAVRKAPRSGSFGINARVRVPGQAGFVLFAVLEKPTIAGFRIEWQTAADLQTRTGSWRLNAWVVGTRASFKISAEIVDTTKLGSFTIEAETAPVGEERGGISLDAFVLGPVGAVFGVTAYLSLPFFTLDAYIDGNDLTLDAFVQPYFRLNAVKRKTQTTGKTFTVNARKALAVSTGSFTVASFKAATGVRYGVATVDAVITSSPFLPDVLYLSAWIAPAPGSFTLNAYTGQHLTLDAWVQPYFRLDAYIQGSNIVYYPPDGAPPTYGPGGPSVPGGGGGRVARRFGIKIELGIANPGQYSESQADYWERQVSIMSGYVNTYEAIPEDQRTPEQNAALATDRQTLANDIKRFQDQIHPHLTWTEYTGDVMWSQTSFTQAARTGNGNFTVTLDGDFPELRGGEEIHLLVDDRKVFGGYVTHVDHQYHFADAPQPRTVLMGVDYNILFDRLYVYNVLHESEQFASTGSHGGDYEPWPWFPVGTPDTEIITKCLRDYVAYNLPPDLDYTTGLQTIGSPAVDTPWGMPEPGSPLRTIFQSISRITSAVWYIDADKVLRYHDRNTVTGPQPITDGFGGISTRDLAISRDMSSMINDAFVWGVLARTDDDEEDEIIYARKQGDGESMEQYYLDAIAEISGYIATYEAIPESQRTARQQQNLVTDRQTLAYNKAQLAYFRANPEADSIGIYGRRQWGEPREDIFSQEWVNKRALSVLRRYQYPILKAEGTIYEPYYAAGQVVQLISAEYGIDESFAISQMTISFVVMQEPDGDTYFALPQYRLAMGLDPEAPWNIYDYLPYPGENDPGMEAKGDTSSGPGPTTTAGGGNVKGLAQRRFWSGLRRGPGVIGIGDWGGIEDCELLASYDGCEWEHVYWGTELAVANLPFPDKFKLHQYWRMTYHAFAPGGQNYGGLHIRSWILKPGETDLTLTGPNEWYRGDPTHNLLWKSSPFWKENEDGEYDENGTLNTRIRYEAHLRFTDTNGNKVIPGWTNFGGLPGLYGYVNDIYFGFNQYGGNKPNVGIEPKYNAVGDLSKTFTGLHGAFGILSGIPHQPVYIDAEWTFDLCDEPQLLEASKLAAIENVRSEGWGTDAIAVNSDGSFEVRVTPVRSTLTVYTAQGFMLHDGVHYEQAEGDTTGRRYQMIANPRNPTRDEEDEQPCAESLWRGADANTGHGGYVDGTQGSSSAGVSPSRCDAEFSNVMALMVTYLVAPPVLENPVPTRRATDPGLTYDGHNATDIRGL